MVDAITVRGLRAVGRHGVLDTEREHGQPFVVDAILTLDTAPAARTDSLSDTVDYADLTQRLAAVIEGEPVNLLETLAQHLADVCLADPRVRQVEVTVHKPEAPVTVVVEDIAVTVRRDRP